MIRRITWRGCAILLSVLAPVTMGDDAGKPGELFPPLEPFETGRLKVSDLHTIWYAQAGDPQGKPVFVLHGGPGWGSYPRLLRYFNPEKYLIVLHDQRGAGQSQPPGELHENTTWDLVEDIERLRKHLKIEGKIMVFGGSWGSTLALAYAETHPEQVSGMVLRGVWTGTREETENGYGGPHMQQFFPETVAQMKAAIPPEIGEFTPQTLLKIVTGKDEAVKDRVIDAWLRYGVKVSSLHPSDEEVAQDFSGIDREPIARIDCYYATMGFFLEEGQLLRDANKLKDIPITIINGRYDMLCPPITAWRLHQQLPKSKLVIVEAAGHSEEEEGTTRALVQAVAEFE